MLHFIHSLFYVSATSTLMKHISTSFTKRFVYLVIPISVEDHHSFYVLFSLDYISKAKWKL